MRADQLERIEAEFQRNFEERGEIGAALSIWEEGDEVLHLCGGVTERSGADSWGKETLIPIYSATKGVSAITLLMAMNQERIEPGWEVRRIWPGFAGRGKRDLTLSDLLSHQGGVAALDQPVEIGDHEATVEAIERQAPNWRLGCGLHGYHPRTFGAILEELARRICSGKRLGEVWRELVGDPHGIDVWIGLPESEFARVGRLSNPREMVNDEFTRAYLDRGSLTRRAFESPRGMNRIESMNRTEGWQMANPAMGGVGSAHGLGKLYGLLSSGNLGEQLPERLQREVVSGVDLVLKTPTAFSLGMMISPAGVGGFGHPGAGGSLGFCDPVESIGFGYVMNQMGGGALPGMRPLSLAKAAFS